MAIKNINKHWILTNPIEVDFNNDTFNILDTSKGRIREYYNINEIFKSKGHFYIKIEEIKYFGNMPILCSSRIYPSYYLGLDVVTFINKELGDENVFWKPCSKVRFNFSALPQALLQDCFTENEEYDVLEVTEYGGFTIRNDYGLIDSYRKCNFILVEEE